MVKVRNEQGLRNKNKMICFPYAGGCASFYGKWKNEINEIEICPIQLPGREESFREEKIYDMETVVEQVLEKIEEGFDSVDSLVEETRLNISKINSIVTLLEMKGFIQDLTGIGLKKN